VINGYNVELESPHGVQTFANNDRNPCGLNCTLYVRIDLRLLRLSRTWRPAKLIKHAVSIARSN